MYGSLYVDEVPVFDDSGKEVGILVFGVYYDKTKYYQGEYTESSLVHMPKQVESHPEPVMVAPSKPNPNKEPVRFYKGACESRNLFSIFDEGSTNQPFRVYERYYRDHLEQQQ